MDSYNLPKMYANKNHNYPHLHKTASTHIKKTHAPNSHPKPNCTHPCTNKSFSHLIQTSNNQKDTHQSSLTPDDGKHTPWKYHLSPRLPFHFHTHRHTTRRHTPYTEGTAGICLNTPDERCASDAPRLGPEGWGKNSPLFF